jgi:hypothetical protein
MMNLQKRKMITLNILIWLWGFWEFVIGMSSSWWITNYNKGKNCAFVMGLGCWEGCMNFWLVPNPIQIWITLNSLVLYFVWFTCSRVDYNKLQFLLVILKFSPLCAHCGNLWSMPKGFNSIIAKLKMSVDSPWWPFKCIMWYQFFGRCFETRKYSCFKMMPKESNEKWYEPIDVPCDNMVEKSLYDY